MTQSSSRHRRKRHPTTPAFAVFALAFAAAATAGLHFGLGLQILWGYLLSLNVATFGTYAYDKAAAARPGASRVPERVLHALAALGGTPAAYVAQHQLRHKTAKGSFRIRFWVIASLQAAFIVAWVVYSRSRP